MSEEAITNYKSLDAPSFLAAVEVDAKKWADAFMQLKEQKGEDWIDHGLMIGWFANAMMAMHDHLHGNPVLNGDHAQYLIDRKKA